MLVRVTCLAEGGQYVRLMNTNTVCYMDARGVMFAPGSHAKLPSGEFERVVALLEKVDPKKVLV